MSVVTSGKHSPLLGRQKRCHGLAYPSFTTYCYKLYRRMREGKVQKAWVHVVGWCEFRMIRRGYCWLSLSNVFLPTCGYSDLRYFILHPACSVPMWDQHVNCNFSHYFTSVEGLNVSLWIQIMWKPLNTTEKTYIKKTVSVPKKWQFHD